MLILCPSRGRPHGALDAWESFKITAERSDTSFLAVVDTDDPKLPSYQHLEIPMSLIEPRGNMVNDLNYVASFCAENYDYIGFIGDDHRFRTPGWDAAYHTTLEQNGGGFAYGNDLFWANGEIPTQIVMSSSIIRTLGWMALPTLKHLYVDNVWKELGDATDSLFYFPRYIVEHLHPAAGKAAWDEQYLRLNSEESYAQDRASFTSWMASTASEDIKRVRSALACDAHPHPDYDSGWAGLSERNSL